MQLYSQKPISVKEARKLLGRDGTKLSDDQVQELIDNLHLLAKKYFAMASSNNAQGI